MFSSNGQEDIVCISVHTQIHPKYSNYKNILVQFSVLKIFVLKYFPGL